MRFEKNDDGTHIHIENKEGEFEVLRAIVQASFDSAIAVGMGIMNYDKNHKLNRSDAGKFINKNQWDTPGSSVVDMDYVGGRQCKTFIKRISKNHFVIATRSFERDRGDITPMLNLANEIIAKESKPGDEVDSSSMFIGESLDKRLAEYGFKRNAGEDDWTFRKRIFPELQLKCPGDPRAIEFLYGKAMDQLSTMEAMLALTVSMEKQTFYSLKKFADGFAADPLKMWPLSKVEA